ALRARSIHHKNAFRRISRLVSLLLQALCGLGSVIEGMEPCAFVAAGRVIGERRRARDQRVIAAATISTQKMPTLNFGSEYSMNRKVIASHPNPAASDRISAGVSLIRFMARHARKSPSRP